MLVTKGKLVSLASCLFITCAVLLGQRADAGAETVDDVFKEVKRMADKGRTDSIKSPAIISVEQFTAPGTYDDVIVVYGYSDNYAAAREIAEYATKKYNRDYRVRTLTR